jgi:hypothetical protein
LLVLVHAVPLGVQITALNFGRVAIDEVVEIPAISGRSVTDLFADAPAGAATAGGGLRITLAPLEGTALLAT